MLSCIKKVICWVLNHQRIRFFGCQAKQELGATSLQLAVNSEAIMARRLMFLPYRQSAEYRTASGIDRIQSKNYK